MPTISDVAERAGVSTKTVSRVLNGEPHVRPQLKERVNAAVAELDYRPNLAARQLAANRSFLIVFLYTTVQVSYVATLLGAASRRCRELGYHLIAEPVEDSGDAAVLVAELVSRLRPDGILLSPPLSDEADLLEALENAGVPVARIAGTRPGVGEIIDIDHQAISAAMTAHLIALGHRRIGFIAATREFRLAQGRLLGFRAAMEEGGLAVDEELVVNGNFTFLSGYHAASLLLAHREPPTAIFAANDEMAAGVVSAAGQRGLRVPDDVAIAGFDDSPISRMIWPPLTTVRQPVAELAVSAIDRLTGQPPSGTPIEHRLVIRASTTGSGGIVEEGPEL